MDEDQIEEKLLGVPIHMGKPGRPHDGDGDGFYSPAPGMPDKTPVPPRIQKPDFDPDFEGTINELGEILGFDAKDTGIRKHIAKRLKPTGKRPTPARGRNPVTYRAGDVAKLIEEARSTSHSKKVTFDKDEVSGTDIANQLGMNRTTVGKLIVRLKLKPIRIQRQGKGRPTAIYNAKEVTEALDAYFKGPRGRGPSGFRKSDPNTTSEIGAEFSEKILGRGIGRRRGPKRMRGIPRDGDGDGFYSPGPGMPDKTPVPPSLRAVASGIPGGGVKHDAASLRRAVEGTKKIESKVLKKHGDVRDRKTARAAMKKAFPKASVRFLDYNDRKEKLDDNEYNFIVGLLHGADLSPRTAASIGDIDRIPKSELPQGQPIWAMGGDFQPGVNPNTGIIETGRIRFNPLSSPSRAKRNEDFGGPGAPWTFQMAQSMKRSGEFSDDDIDRIHQMGIALHEFGHAMHFEHGRRWHEINSGSDRVPPEVYKDSIVQFMNVFASTQGLQPEEKRLITNQILELERQLKITAPPGVTSQQIGAALVATVLENFFASDDATQVEVSSLWSMYFMSQIGWDGVSDRQERNRIRKALADVSGYAGFGFDENPASQYMEGIAEALSLRQVAGDDSLPSLTDLAADHLMDITTKSALNKTTMKTNLKISKMDKTPEKIAKDYFSGKNKPKLPDQVAPLCRGLGATPEAEEAFARKETEEK